MKLLLALTVIALTACASTSETYRGTKLLLACDAAPQTRLAKFGLDLPVGYLTEKRIVPAEVPVEVTITYKKAPMIDTKVTCNFDKDDNLLSVQAVK